MKNLYEELKKLNTYPFHMPGHKRQLKDYPMSGFYDIDITEITGFDNLHSPAGILKDLSLRFEAVYGCKTYLLVNGSSCGVLSAISSVLKKGESLLMARNSHKSAYYAAYQQQLQVKYIYPKLLPDGGICGGIKPGQLKKALSENDDIGAFFLTSPTYEGVLSNIKALAVICHEHGIPIIVDEAHGAHLVLDERFPADAISQGADIVVHSIHKTLPALTQSALLHVQGDIVDRERLEFFLKIYQSSSPSYILMAGMGECVRILENESKKYCDFFFENDNNFKEKTANLKNLKILSEKEAGIFDTSRKVIIPKGTFSGKEVFSFLQDKNLELEMATPLYAVAITTVMDSREGMECLADALCMLDMEMDIKEKTEMGVRSGKTQKYDGKFDAEISTFSYSGMAVSKEKLPIYIAMDSEKELCLLDKACKRVSADYIMLYPPGVPLLVPGEVISEKCIQIILEYMERGFEFDGICGGSILVVGGAL